MRSPVTWFYESLLSEQEKASVFKTVTVTLIIVHGTTNADLYMQVLSSWFVTTY